MFGNKKLAVELTKKIFAKWFEKSTFIYSCLSIKMDIVINYFIKESIKLYVILLKYYQECNKII